MQISQRLAQALQGETIGLGQHAHAVENDCGGAPGGFCLVAQMSRRARALAPRLGLFLVGAARLIRASDDLQMCRLAGASHGVMPYQIPDGVAARLLRMPHGLLLARSEEHTSELQSPLNLVCRLL